MKTTHRLTLSLFLLALLAIPTFAVLAKELGRLTISGPGIKGELTLDDPNELMSLWEAGIIDTYGFVKAPDGLGQGYTINTYMNIEDGKQIPFIEMVYYPAEEGQQGYVHITGRLQEGTTLTPADDWSRMTLTADKALRMVLKGHNIQLQTAVLVAPVAAAPEKSVAEAPAAADPAAQKTTTSAPSMPAVPPYVGWTAIALTVGAMLLLGRRSLSRRTVS
jgi:hypothetical protein